jgi:Tfp pilus assembly protein PilN
MSPINLVPATILAQREARRRLRRWIATLGLAVAVLTPAYVVLARFAAARQAEVRRVTGQCVLLQQRLQGAEGLIQERDRLALRRTAVGRMSTGEPAAEILAMLGRALTPDSYLTVLSMERCEPVDTEENQEPTEPREACQPVLHLRGRAAGNRQVGEILRRLGAEPVLREVTLVSATDPGAELGPSEIEFELLCVLADGARSDAPAAP